MKTRFLIVSGIAFLSMLLVYSGVAWVFENCLRHQDESIEEPVRGDDFAITSPADIVARSTNKEPVERVHCLAAYHTFEAITQASSTTSSSKQFYRSHPVTFVQFSRSATRGDIDAVRRDSPPGSTVGYLASSRVSRHLSLAVFLV